MALEMFRCMSCKQMKPIKDLYIQTGEAVCRACFEHKAEVIKKRKTVQVDVEGWIKYEGEKEKRKK